MHPATRHHVYAFSTSGNKEQREVQSQGRAASFAWLGIEKVERWPLGSCSEHNAWPMVPLVNMGRREELVGSLGTASLGEERLMSRWTGRIIHSLTVLVNGGFPKPWCGNCVTLALAIEKRTGCTIVDKAMHPG